MSANILQTRINVEGPTWLCGDIHSDMGEFFHQIALKKIKDSNIILLGDVGVGFWGLTNPNNFFRFMSKQLEVKNNVVYLIRGNHDNPEFWEKPLRDNVESQWSNIKFVDEDFITINKDVFFVLSGGVSIDRCEENIRKEGVTWWRGERVKYIKPEEVASKWEDMCDQEYVKKYLNVDNNGGEFAQIKGILSHVGPRPNILDDSQLIRRSKVDKRLIDDIQEENEVVENVTQGIINLNDNIAKIVNKPAQLPVWHFYGHYHVSWENFNSVICKKCLNIQEFYQIYS